MDKVGKSGSGIRYSVVEGFRDRVDKFAAGKIPGIQAAHIEIVSVDGHIKEAYLRGFRHTEKIDVRLTRTEINQLCLETNLKMLTEREAAPPEPVIIDRGNEAITSPYNKLMNALKGNP